MSEAVELERLLRETRRRLYATAANTASDPFEADTALPNSEAEALERRVQGGLRAAELDHRRAVAKLASSDTPLPFADAARRINAEPPEPPADSASTPVVSQWTLDPASSKYEKVLRTLGFPEGLPTGGVRVVDAAAGDVLLVVGQQGASETAVDVAVRLRGRLEGRGVDTEVVLGGARTVLPGEQRRVRSAEEFEQLRAQVPQKAIVLTLINSKIATHHRIASRIAASVDFAQVWVCVDALMQKAALEKAVTDLPGQVNADAVALTHAWDARKPGQGLNLGVSVGLVDGAPSTPHLWQLIVEDAVARMQL